ALGHAPRLVGVVGGRLAGVDLAEVAAPRALRAADEEGRRPVFPAFVDVGAAGLLADRVQPLVLHERLEGLILRPHHRLRLDPFGLALDRHGRVADLDAQQPPAVGAGRRGGCRGAAGAHAATSTGAAAMKAEATASTTSAGETSAPRTSLRVVTPASAIPQGTIVAKPLSELSQFSAKPCPGP